MLLFLHLTLLFRFHCFKGNLTEEERCGIERWTSEVFLKWVKSNEEIRADLDTILKQGDLLPDSFLSWIQSKLNSEAEQ
jgi:hypothetical protein